MSLYIKYGHEILQSICRCLIPYLGTFWITGSRLGRMKIESLLFYVLQIPPRLLGYTNWQEDLRAASLNIAFLLFRSDLVLIPYLATFFYRGLLGWLDKHCIFIVSYPPNSTRTSAICTFTDGLEGWQVQIRHCLGMAIPINYPTYKKTLFSILNY